MKVFTHDAFLSVYVRDPAAASGRIEAILSAIQGEVEIEEAYPAGEDDILRAHTRSHVRSVSTMGLYNVAALAAGASMQAAEAGMEGPSFGLVRPPGHHASADRAWGFCYFNNMAIALEHLRSTGRIKKAHLLDFDLHYGDGNANILEPKGYVTIHNPDNDDREVYLAEVAARLESVEADVIAVSAGFDNHVQDWGQTLRTEDYHKMGKLVHAACKRLSAGCFALLEGGYNHLVLGTNVREFLRGLQGL